MRARQCPLPRIWPRIWLVSDARNDAALEAALKRLPRGSGLVFRHYHLDADARRQRFAELKQLARARGHVVVLSGSAREARRWSADGAYGSSSCVAGGPATLRLITVHSLRELAAAGRADAVLLSPVFATRSHSAARPLGAVRFRLIAQRSHVPVIALGGMTAKRARGLQHWGAIDGLTTRDS